MKKKKSMSFKIIIARGINRPTDITHPCSLQSVNTHQRHSFSSSSLSMFYEFNICCYLWLPNSN